MEYNYAQTSCFGTLVSLPAESSFLVRCVVLCHIGGKETCMKWRVHPEGGGKSERLDSRVLSAYCSDNLPSLRVAGWRVTFVTCYGGSASARGCLPCGFPLRMFRLDRLSGNYTWVSATIFSSRCSEIEGIQSEAIFRGVPPFRTCCNIQGTCEALHTFQKPSPAWSSTCRWMLPDLPFKISRRRLSPARDEKPCGIYQSAF